MALGFFSRLREGLSRSTQKLGGGITSVFTRRRLDEAALEELEEVLIAADLGPAVAGRVIDVFRRTRFGREVTDDEVKEALAIEISRVLEPVAISFEPDPERHPHVVLVVGVNGTGKTTTIGKLALQQRERGRSSVLAACDTFRAAAVEQLQIWGERVGAPVISGPANTDPAGLAFDAMARATEAGADLLLIDTAGRLHNRTALMEELKKIIRVIRKRDATAPIRCCWCSTPPPARTPSSRCACSARWSTSRGSWSPSSTARPAAASWWRWPRPSACRCIWSASARKPRISATSRPRSSHAAWWATCAASAARSRSRRPEFWPKARTRWGSARNSARIEPILDLRH